MPVQIQQKPFSTDFKKVCGLYKITIADKFYYGSSNNLYNRYYQHIPELRHNKHKNKYLQSAFNKYKQFEFNVLCICEPNQRRELEEKLLQQCIDDKLCMNLTLRTEGPSGIKWSEESRQRQSEKMKGNTNGRHSKGVKRIWSTDAREHHRLSVGKKIIAVDGSGNISTYLHVKDAYLALGVSERTFFRWFKKPNTVRRKYKDWVFSYEGGVN